MRIDFHTHTTCSDGQYTPEELVQKAAAAGICALAITDHDAVSGIARGKQAAKAFPQLQIFPGIEISAKENPQLHILGYGIDGENADLQAYITRNRTLRQGRRERMLSFLAEKGVPVTIEEVAAANNGCTTGRPHFAKTMLLKGYVSSVSEAFDRYLGTPEFLEKVERPKPTAVESIHLIQAAGGIAVLAHPAKLNLSQPDFLQLLSTLCEAGLWGIEAYYSTHSPEEMADSLLRNWRWQWFYKNRKLLGCQDFENICNLDNKIPDLLQEEYRQSIQILQNKIHIALQAEN